MNESKYFVKFIIKTLIANLIFITGGIFWLRILLRKKNVLYVLNYHNFSKYQNYHIKRGSILETGFENNFGKQIRYLKRHFNFCYPDEFFEIENNPKSGINVLLTFDDGYKDNYDIAFPILKNYNASAIFFIPTSYIGLDDWLWHDKVHLLVNQNLINQGEADKVLYEMNQGKPVPKNFMEKIERNFGKMPKSRNSRLLMNWEEIKELYRNGFKIGSHTCNHKILSYIDHMESEMEIRDSISTINEKLNTQCDTFAYPNGLYKKDSFGLLIRNGIRYAFSTIKGTNSLNQDKLTIKRIGINASDSIPILLTKLLAHHRY